LQELALWFLLGQRQSFLIRGPSLSGLAEPAAHIGAGGMRQIIIGQFALLEHLVDMRQTGLRSIAHGDRYGAIELNRGRRLNSCQLVIQRDNLPPVGRRDGFRFGMNGGNRSLVVAALDFLFHLDWLVEYEVGLENPFS
jgi:hypothetical protein